MVSGYLSKIMYKHWTVSTLSYMMNMVLQIFQSVSQPPAKVETGNCMLKNNAFHLLAGDCGTRSTLIRMMFLHSSLHGKKQREIQGNSLQSYLSFICRLVL